MTSHGSGGERPEVACLPAALPTFLLSMDTRGAIGAPFAELLCLWGFDRATRLLRSRESILSDSAFRPIG